MCGYCCGGVPKEKRGEGHKNCADECYNAPRKKWKPAAAPRDQTEDGLAERVRLAQAWSEGEEAGRKAENARWKRQVDPRIPRPPMVLPNPYNPTLLTQSDATASEEDQR